MSVLTKPITWLIDKFFSSLGRLGWGETVYQGRTPDGALHRKPRTKIGNFKSRLKLELMHQLLMTGGDSESGLVPGGTLPRNIVLTPEFPVAPHPVTLS